MDVVGLTRSDGLVLQGSGAHGPREQERAARRDPGLKALRFTGGPRDFCWMYAAMASLINTASTAANSAQTDSAVNAGSMDSTDADATRPCESPPISNAVLDLVGGVARSVRSKRSISATAAAHRRRGAPPGSASR